MASSMTQNSGPKGNGTSSTNLLQVTDGHSPNKSRADQVISLSLTQLAGDNMRHSFPKPSQSSGLTAAKTQQEPAPTITASTNTAGSVAFLKSLPPEALTVFKKLNNQNIVGQSPHLRARLTEVISPQGHGNLHPQQYNASPDALMVDLEKSFQNNKMKDVGLSRTVALSQEYKPRVAAKSRTNGIYSLIPDNMTQPPAKISAVSHVNIGITGGSTNRQLQYGMMQYSVISHIVGQFQSPQNHQNSNMTKSPQKSNITITGTNEKDPKEKELSSSILRKGSGQKIRTLVGNIVADTTMFGSKQPNALPQIGLSAKEGKLLSQMNPKPSGLVGQAFQSKLQVLPAVSANQRQLDLKSYNEDTEQLITASSTKKILKKQITQSPKPLEDQGQKPLIQNPSSNAQQMLVALNPRNRGASTSDGPESAPGRNLMRRVNRLRAPILSRADKKCNILFNLFCSVFPCARLASAKCGIGLGNNDKLIEKMLKAKGFTTETFFSKCNIVWTQGVNKRTAMVKSGTGLIEMDLRSEKTPDNIRMYKIKSAEALSQQIQACKLFYVSPENISLLREACERAKSGAKLLVVNPEEFTLMNHMKGLKYITRKHLLYQTMKEYCEKNKLAISDLVPETWVLRGDTFEADLENLIKEKAAKNDFYKDPLIVKPGENSNRGQGIEMAFNEDEVRLLTSFLLESRKNTSSVVVQTYISNPMLFAKRKFDIRCYALVIRSPYKTSFFWYSQGYARTCSFEYSPACKENLMVHLTNEAVQVKDPKNFGKYEPGNKVYYDQLEDYFATCEEFQSRNMRFTRDIVPKFKVGYLVRARNLR
jgi:Tubulin-tyrosine ligase family